MLDGRFVALLLLHDRPSLGCGQARRLHEGLRGDARVVHARAAEHGVGAFDDGDRLPCVGERRAEGPPGRSESDDGRVVVLHGVVLSLGVGVRAEGGASAALHGKRMRGSGHLRAKTAPKR